MPRQPLVTRTFIVTIAKVKFINTESGDVIDSDVILTKLFKNNNEIIKAVNKSIKENDKQTKLKAVHVISTKTESRLYGMKETDFIKHAVLMKDRKQKI
jgi:hypothetical protein